MSSRFLAVRFCTMDGANSLNETRTASPGRIALTTAAAILALLSMPGLASAAGSGPPFPMTREERILFQSRPPQEALETIREIMRNRRLAVGASGLVRSTRATPSAADGIWSELPPPSREFHSLVYDSHNDRLLTVGGNRYHSTTPWAMDLGTQTWSVLANGPSYSPAVYDPTEHRLLAYDNRYDSGEAPRLLEMHLDGPKIWSPIGPIPHLPLLRPAVMAWDAQRRRIILVGSGEPHGDTTDVWIVDLSGEPSCEPVVAQGPAVSAYAFDNGNNGYAIPFAYDHARNRVYVTASFDGTVGALDLNSSPTWMLMESPIPQFGFACDPYHTLYLVVDEAADELIVFTDWGCAWAVPGSGGPARTLADDRQVDRYEASAVAFDPARRRVVMQGGVFYHSLGTVSETRVLPLDGDAVWQRVGPYSGGARGGAHRTVVDPLRERVIVYGGRLPGGPIPDPLIERSLRDDALGAVPLVTAPGPSPGLEAGHSMVLDPVRDRVLVYGGGNLWELALGTPPTWTQLFPEGEGPGPRAWHTALYDPYRDRMLIFGGGTGACSSAVVWALPLTPPLVWHPIAVVGVSCDALEGYGFFDDRYDRVLLYDRADTLRVMTFEGDHAVVQTIPIANSEVEPCGWPSIRPLIFDPVRQRIVAVPSQSCSERRGEFDRILALTLNPTPHWEEYSTFGEPPLHRGSEADIYDPGRDRMMMYGGYDDDHHYMDDWNALTWGAPTPVQASVLESFAEDGVVRITWYTASIVGALGVERRSPTTEWTALGDGWHEEHDRVVLEDHAVEPGLTYDYRLRDGDSRVGEVRITVPALGALAVVGPTTNPVTGDLHVRLALPNSRPAAIDLFGVDGRRVGHMDLRGFDAGEHDVLVASRAALTPGVYYLLLKQGTESRSTRVVVLR